MKNSLKRILTLLPVLIMVCLLAVAPVASADGREGLAAEERGVADAAGGVYKVDGDVDKDIRKVALFTDRNGGPKILVEEYSGEDVKYGNNGYYIKINANDKIYENINSLEALVSIVEGAKSSYKAIATDGTEVTLNATWHADTDNPEFKKPGYINETNGMAKNVWYYFTADLEVAPSSDYNKENYEIKLDSPKAYIRVYPAIALNTFESESTIKTVQKIKELANINELGLPTKVSLAYRIADPDPEEEREAATFRRTREADFMQFPAEENVVHISKAIGQPQRVDDACLRY